MKKINCFFGIFMLSMICNAQRNVILIIADDLGTDYFGFYEDHQDTVDVPHIRGLLRNGVRFTNAMANPVCSATRAGMLTGRYSFRTGVGYIVGNSQGSGSLDTSESTIPRVLKNFNPAIATANIGKWHLQDPVPVGNLLFPNVLGYDLFEGSFIGAIPSYTNWIKHTNGVAGTVTNYATSETVNDAVSWIKSLTGNPFFLWLAFNAPHEPLHLPPANLHTYSSLSGTPADINAHPKPYFKAMIQSLDTEIGRLFDSLQVLNRLDSTDIIFIGDNGNTTRTAQIANAGRAKGTIYQYGVHVPLIISGPSVINPGRSSDALINAQDIFATTIELFGNSNWLTQIPANKPVDSKSILPIIKNQSTQIRSWSFTEVFKNSPDFNDGKAMRNATYKLLKFDNGQEAFYDLDADSFEVNNLLSGSLNGTELTNYNYLCNEMTVLVGTGSFCNSSVGINNPGNNSLLPLAYPNPFTSHIFLNSNPGDKQVELFNSFGKIIYSGKHLELQNFSELGIGIYYLKSADGKAVRLIKL